MSRRALPRYNILDENYSCFRVRFCVDRETKRESDSELSDGVI
ncbi:hypothetical protein MY3296_007850 [Beauveria thailandica]